MQFSAKDKVTKAKKRQQRNSYPNWFKLTVAYLCDDYVNKKGDRRGQFADVAKMVGVDESLVRKWSKAEERTRLEAMPDGKKADRGRKPKQKPPTPPLDPIQQVTVIRRYQSVIRYAADHATVAKQFHAKEVMLVSNDREKDVHNHFIKNVVADDAQVVDANECHDDEMAFIDDILNSDEWMSQLRGVDLDSLEMSLEKRAQMDAIGDLSPLTLSDRFGIDGTTSLKEMPAEEIANALGEKIESEDLTNLFEDFGF